MTPLRDLHTDKAERYAALSRFIKENFPEHMGWGDVDGLFFGSVFERRDSNGHYRRGREYTRTGLIEWKSCSPICGWHQFRMFNEWDQRLREVDDRWYAGLWMIVYHARLITEAVAFDVYRAPFLEHERIPGRGIVIDSVWKKIGQTKDQLRRFGKDPQTWFQAR